MNKKISESGENRNVLPAFFVQITAKYFTLFQNIFLFSKKITNGKMKPR